MSSFASHKSPIDFSTDLALTGLFKAKDFKGTLKKKALISYYKCHCFWKEVYLLTISIN
jgi:hypothetical protein